MPGLNVGEALGIRPRYSDSTNLGGASFVSHLLHAAAAISAGLCEVALIAYGSTQRSDGGKLRSVVEPDPHEALAECVSWLWENPTPGRFAPGLRPAAKGRTGGRPPG
jgi:acetyl-CoA acetyltransferase